VSPPQSPGANGAAHFLLSGIRQLHLGRRKTETFQLQLFPPKADDKAWDT
jgi:hypothetical protein